METFTGFEYLLIDAANQFGLDKNLFHERLQWANTNLEYMEELAETADNKPLYLKAVQAIRKAQAGQPTGHMVGLDAVCSGMQIMSALTGCQGGAKATGLVDPNKRSDAYTEVTKTMSKILGHSQSVSRADAKDATMKTLYGSKAEPKKIFGEGTDQLNAFYKALYKVAPGPVELLEDLLNSWQPFALSHSWKLPDGFDVRVKVMQKVEDCRIEVDELDHATFAYQYYVNEGSEKGLANAANMVHSVDAYILRSLVRRCNYDPDVVEEATQLIETELLERELGIAPRGKFTYVEPSKACYYRDQYTRSGMADPVIFPYLNVINITHLSTQHLKELATIANSMLAHKPFPIISIHDDFKCHANNMNHLRQHYINVFAELADSNTLDDILSQLYGVQGHFDKKSQNLSQAIRNSNYALS